MYKYTCAHLMCHDLSSYCFFYSDGYIDSCFLLVFTSVVCLIAHFSHVLGERERERNPTFSTLVYFSIGRDIRGSFLMDPGETAETARSWGALASAFYGPFRIIQLRKMTETAPCPTCSFLLIILYVRMDLSCKASL